MVISCEQEHGWIDDHQDYDIALQAWTLATEPVSSSEG